MGRNPSQEEATPNAPIDRQYPGALILAFAAPLAAQDDRWQLTLEGDHYVWDIRLVRLDGDSLVVRQSDSLVRVPVALINEIRLIRKSEAQMTGGGATSLVP